MILCYYGNSDTLQVEPCFLKHNMWIQLKHDWTTKASKVIVFHFTNTRVVNAFHKIDRICKLSCKHQKKSPPHPTRPHSKFFQGSAPFPSSPAEKWYSSQEEVTHFPAWMEQALQQALGNRQQPYLTPAIAGAWFLKQCFPLAEPWVMTLTPRKAPCSEVQGTPCKVWVPCQCNFHVNNPAQRIMPKALWDRWRGPGEMQDPKEVD